MSSEPIGRLHPRVIVALDYDNIAHVKQLVSMLTPSLCALKVGKELFTKFGPSLVESLIKQGFMVFLDLKFHDIPNTVYKACKLASELGVWMLNVHASGGIEMLQAAKEGVEAGYSCNSPTSNNYQTPPSSPNNTPQRPLLIAVTILTSLTWQHLQTMFGNLSLTNTIHQHSYSANDTPSHIDDSTQLGRIVLNLAELAYLAKLDGVVCSAHEVPIIKSHVSQTFITVTPGIRLDAITHSSKNNAKDDQQRTMNVQQAINNGADYLVIGRPITTASNPQEVLLTINQQICQQLASTCFT